MRFQVGGTGLGIGVGFWGLMNPLEVKFSYAWVRVIPRSENSRQGYIHGIGCFRSGRSSSICLLDRRLALTFLQLPIINGIFDPSSTITQLPKELIGDYRSLLLYAESKFLIIMLICSFSFGLLTILDAFPFDLVMYSKKVYPTPCLVVSKSLKVTSILVLKMN